jgi:hypothetical protein
MVWLPPAKPDFAFLLMAGLREWPMRFFLVAIMTLGLGGGAALAQTVSEALRSSKSRHNEQDSAVMDCVKMWDSGTHMTKQQWSRTCKRVQTRLDNLKVDAIIPKPKTQVR